MVIERMSKSNHTTGDLRTLDIGLWTLDFLNDLEWSSREFRSLTTQPKICGLWTLDIGLWTLDFLKELIDGSINHSQRHDLPQPVSSWLRAAGNKRACDCQVV